jgi:hypothetical protein
MLPTTKYHITGKLITPKVKQLADEAIGKFHKLNLTSAPFCDVVGELSGYEFTTTTRNCGGYCSPKKKVIALGQTSDAAMITIFHELAHTFQFKEVSFEMKDTVTMSAYLSLEHEAESVAYRMYNGCIGYKHHSAFNAYFDRYGILFLKDWVKGSGLYDDININ